MKKNKLFRILAVAVTLSLLMLAIPATPALAAASITLLPTSGPPGEVITVTGTGFTASTAGYVWFDSDGYGDRDTGEPQRLVTTTTGGDLPAGVTLTVPTEPRGTYYVQADIPSGSTVEASATFTITPEIELDAFSGNVGDTIKVDGYGFNDSATITIYYDGESIGTDYTDGYGTFEDFTLTIPDSTEGTHPVKARDSSGYSPAVNFTVSPEITISPTSGAVGDTITVSGTGFAASSDIIIYFDGDEVDITAGDNDTNSDGSFSDATFIIPDTSRGSHTIKAKDEDNNYDTATFTVAQKITIDPTSGSSGTTVTVTGTGFKANYAITIKYDGTTVATSPTTVTTNPTGYFSATFNVPASMAGTYVVEASDGTNTATANFVSTTDATISQTTTVAAPGHVGMELTITGTGFAPNATVTVTYETTPVTLATVPTDASGNFTAPITIPASVGGAHTITVSDGSISKVFDFVMESSAPPVPLLLLPLVDEKAASETSFEWNPVSDVSPASSPVTYDLQVAADAYFTNILVEKTGLTTPTYTLLEEERLESTSKEEPYYWRVRAVDAASNASDWCYASTFYVGFTFEFTGWVVYVTMALIAVAFFFLGLWLGRRRGIGEFD
jgi:hypothetical protein